MLVIASLALMVRQLAPGTSLAVFVSWFHTALADIAVDVRSPVLILIVSTIICSIIDGERLPAYFASACLAFITVNIC